VAEPDPGAIILVVDDTLDSLRLLTDTIGREGMTVLVATDGEQALALLGNCAESGSMPDLILMDAIMPGLDGFETTRAIKMDPALAHIPIIFMTGLGDSEHVVKALAAGGVDYVRKPIVIDELLARLQVHLANARVSHAGRAALDATGRHLFALDAEGAMLWLTPQAQRLLAGLAEGWTRSTGHVPALLAPAVQRLLQADAREGGTVKIEHEGTSLELQRVPAANPAERLFRLTASCEAESIALLQHRHGLTQREAEVLLWVSYGKPNRVISEILGISPRTVNKHLEQVFEKLGVETRAAAAAFAVRTMTP
jgi:DNA-binding response OmpR family regulator/DNA-binding CsgD family transcriptional regulator